MLSQLPCLKLLSKRPRLTHARYANSQAVQVLIHVFRRARARRYTVDRPYRCGACMCNPQELSLYDTRTQQLLGQVRPGSNWNNAQHLAMAATCQQ